MRYFLVSIAVFFPVQAVAGSLVPITDQSGLSANSASVALESSNATTGLRTENAASSLVGQAPGSFLTALRNDEGLDGNGEALELFGNGQADGITGFVETPPPPPRPPEPQPEPQPLQFELRDLHFEYDSALLAPTEKSVIAELASVIFRSSPRGVTLIGHTDRRGASDYNLNLSQRRALAVRNALIEWHDFDPLLFRVIGRGEEELLSAGVTEADHARDRRVVVVLNQ